MERNMNKQLITCCQNEEIKLSPIFGRTEDERAMGDYANSYRGNSNATFSLSVPFSWVGHASASFSKFSISIQSNRLQCKSKYTIHFLTRVTTVRKGPWTFPLNDRSTLWESCVLCACTYSVDRTQSEFARFLELSIEMTLIKNIFSVISPFIYY